MNRAPTPNAHTIFPQHPFEQVIGLSTKLGSFVSCDCGNAHVHTAHTRSHNHTRPVYCVQHHGPPCSRSGVAGSSRAPHTHAHPTHTPSTTTLHAPRTHTHDASSSLAVHLLHAFTTNPVRLRHAFTFTHPVRLLRGVCALEPRGARRSIFRVGV